MTIRYTVEVLRSGQPRPYADTEREYLISVETKGYLDKELHAGFPDGNLDETIAQEEDDRKSGRMFGGYPPDALRKRRRDYALSLVRSLCQNFREPNDDDGRKDMEAHFYPTLRKLHIDEAAGTIRALIVEPFTD